MRAVCEPDDDQMIGDRTGGGEMLGKKYAEVQITKKKETEAGLSPGGFLKA